MIETLREVSPSYIMSLNISTNQQLINYLRNFLTMVHIVTRNDDNGNTHT